MALGALLITSRFSETGFCIPVKFFYLGQLLDTLWSFIIVFNKIYC